eukprot:15049235-Alexandrium_andersonii.AAC.1
MRAGAMCTQYEPNSNDRPRQAKGPAPAACVPLGWGASKIALHVRAPAEPLMQPGPSCPCAHPSPWAWSCAGGAASGPPRT